MKMRRGGSPLVLFSGIVRTYEIRATRRDGEPVARGTYRIRLGLMVPDFPELETSFRVR